MTISATTQGIKPGVCTSTNRPVNPFDGQVIYMTDVDQTAVWDGTQWTVLAPVAGGRNRVINGGMNIWQRGTSFTNPGAGGTYTADRWNTYFNGTGTVVQETTTVPTGSQYAIKLTSTSTNGGIAAYQLIEAANVYPLQNKTVVLSLQVAGTTAVGISLAYSTTANDTLTNTSTALTATTILNPTISASLQTYSFSFLVPSTAKTLRIGVGTGSVVNTNYIIFGNVQLEVGAVATPFEFEDAQVTLAKCQRYYYRATSANNGNTFFGQLGVAAGTTNCVLPYTLPVTMRANPSAIDYSGMVLYESQSGAAFSIGTLTLNQTHPNTPLLYTIGNSGLTSGRNYLMFANSSTTAYLGITAEL
jgi:hypothetical protein